MNKRALEELSYQFEEEVSKWCHQYHSEIDNHFVVRAKWS